MGLLKGDKKMKEIAIKFYKFEELTEEVQDKLVWKYVHDENEYFPDIGMQENQFSEGDYDLMCGTGDIQNLYVQLMNYKRKMLTMDAYESVFKVELCKQDLENYLNKVIEVGKKQFDWSGIKDLNSVIEAYKIRVLQRVEHWEYTEFDYDFEQLFNKYDYIELQAIASDIQEIIKELSYQILETLHYIKERTTDPDWQRECFLFSLKDGEMFTESGIKYSDLFIEEE